MVRFIKRFIWALRDYGHFRAFFVNMSGNAKKQLERDFTPEDWKVINSRFYYAWIHACDEIRTARERKRTK